MPNQPITFQNQRQFLRREFQIPVVAVYEGTVSFDTSVNISEGGMLLRTDKQYPTGARIKIHIELFGSETVKTDAEAVYSLDFEKQHLVGFRFINPPSGLVQVIRALVAPEMNP